MFQQIWKINEPRKKRHVAQKPVELLINLIQIIEHNEDLIVVDRLRELGPLGKHVRNWVSSIKVMILVYG